MATDTYECLTKIERQQTYFMMLHLWSVEVISIDTVFHAVKCSNILLADQ